MGIGDDLMACGEARHMHARTGRKVCIRRRDGKPYWSPIWDGVPFLVRRPDATVDTIINGGGPRPYIDTKAADRWTWKRYTPRPGLIVLKPDEIAFAVPHAGRVMIEPHGKAIGHTNKIYPFNRWLEVVRAMPETQFVQCGAGDMPWLMAPNVKHVVTPSFRHAAAVLAVSTALASGEGGLMHAAAALGVRGVIVYGGFISPASTGYALHKNLFTGTGLGCGMRTVCVHCFKCHSGIPPPTIVSNLKEIL